MLAGLALAARHAPVSLLRLTLRHFPRVVLEVLLGLAVLVIVPFLSGSARKQAGRRAAPSWTAASC